jgi:hypothetical protein
MKKRLFPIALGLWLFTAALYAQAGGNTGFEFLRNQYSPRGAAMAGNLFAVKNDLHAVYYNPAALSGSSQHQWTINYVDHLLDFQGGFLGYSQPLSRVGTVHANLIYFNYGDFQETDEFGIQTGRTFGASEFAFSVGMSNTLGEGFDYGLTMRYIFSSLDTYNASAIALDAGLIYTAGFMKDLTFGVSLLNLGATLDNYTEVKEKLPVTLNIGFAKRLAHLPLLLTGSLVDVAASGDSFAERMKRFSIGGEFDLSSMIQFRLGYQNEVNRAVKPLGRTVLGGVSLGLGIHWRQFRLDYAFSNYGDLGNQNRIGITGTF